MVAAMCCVCVLFTGCEQAEDSNAMEEGLEMSLIADIGQSNHFISSRYAGTSPNDITFAKDDEIGVMVDEGEFVQWEYNGVQWFPVGNAIYWKNREEIHNFYAFYPYADNASLESVPMPSLTNQNGTMADLGKYDFLVADKTQTYGSDGTVSFVGENAFTHVSSLVCITVKGGGDLNTAVLNKISIEGDNLITPSSYSFSEKKVTLVESEQNELSIEPENVTMSSEDKIFYFILNSSTTSLSTVTLSIHYTIGNVAYKATKVGLSIANDDDFGSGKQYAYAVTVVDNTLKITGNTIKNWQEGGSLGDIIIYGEKEEAQS